MFNFPFSLWHDIIHVRFYQTNFQTNMSQRQWIVIIGVWVMVFLFLGFPSSWEKVFAILTGLLIIFLAYRIRFKEAVPSKESVFTDSMPPARPAASPTATPDAKQ